MNFLVDYGDDSSEDEVPGPRVSVKRPHRDEDTEEQPKKLPLPKQFSASKPEEYIDDPSLHEGRVRSFKHERGNWASFAYIPFVNTPEMREFCVYIQQLVPPQLGLNISADFHISLTKTIILKHHWITSFVDTIKLGLDGFRRFLILFEGIKVYCNEERTRTFLGIQIKSGFDSLKQLVKIFDNCLVEYQLASFYKDPSFHMSIAWCVGDHRNELEQFTKQINEKLSNYNNIYIVADTVLCKIGNKQFEFSLT